MSTTDGWDLTVPEDAAELLAELRRHGIQPGQRLHVAHVLDPASDFSRRSTTSGRYVSDDSARRDAAEDDPGDKAGRRRLRFVGSVHDAPPDLAENTDEYLRRGFGQ
jgi:hypothetical protein